MCTPWKDKRWGDTYRVLGKASVRRQFTKAKRLSRKDVPRQEDW